MQKGKHSGDMREMPVPWKPKEESKCRAEGVGCYWCCEHPRLKKINTEKRLWNSVTQCPVVLSERAVFTG